MQPTIKILERLNKDSQDKTEQIFTRLYRYLLRKDIYFIAYNKLYRNNGAATEGVNNDTADGFSERYIDKLIASLSTESYNPLPVRRTYIEKSNGRKRPLGIPTFKDKLVQEVVRMILEAVYEPVFLNCSHGFRPNRSCHTALKQLKNNFNGMAWFIEGDIKGCFDNIDHSVLLNILYKKIKDIRLINLIRKFLKAGYMENWVYNKTHSGTPQGGIMSPILTNIYLNELDKKLQAVQADFEKVGRKVNPEYARLNGRINKKKQKVKKLSGKEREELINECKLLTQQLKTLPWKSNENKSLRYVRYADDFLIGVKGSKEDCIALKKQLQEYVANELKMELSEEKTLITHSENSVRFLGYDISVRRSGQIKRMANGIKQRTLNNLVEFLVPMKDKIERFMKDKAVVKVIDGKYYPIHRKKLLGLTDLEIIATYNAELRGLANYYRLACNYWRLEYFRYMMEYSFLKTLARKHNTSISKLKTAMRCGKEYGVKYLTKDGTRLMTFASLKAIKARNDFSDTISQAENMYRQSVSTLEKRLNANCCELCGKDDGKFEIHHINKVKNLKGKLEWERAMIAKRRKTLVVCEECHKSIHSKR